MDLSDMLDGLLAKQTADDDTSVSDKGEPAAAEQALEPSVSDMLNSLVAELTATTADKKEKTFLDEEEELNPQAEQHRKALGSLVDITRGMQQTLRRELCGQDNAVFDFCEGYFRNAITSGKSGKAQRPTTFLFVGPKGVGKYTLAKNAAQYLGKKIVRFNMNEYADADASCFSDAMTKAVANGADMLCIEEVESASVTAVSALTRILNDDSGNNAAFSSVLFVITTNVGDGLYELFPTDGSGADREDVKETLKRSSITDVAFPRHLLSVLPNIQTVIFNRLSAEHVTEIALRTFSDLASNFAGEYGVEVVYDELLPIFTLFTCGGAADAREVKSRAESFFKKEILELYQLIGKSKTVDKVGKIRFSLDVKGAQGGIKQLFDAHPVTFLVFTESTALRELPSSRGYKVIVTDSFDKARSLLLDGRIDIVLDDICCKKHRNSIRYASPEDFVTDGRRLLRELKDLAAVPLYLAETENFAFDDSYAAAFARAGASGKVNLTLTAERIAEQLSELARIANVKTAALQLEKSNLTLQYNTAQRISEGGSRAEIVIYDMELRHNTAKRGGETGIYDVVRVDTDFDTLVGFSELKDLLAETLCCLAKPLKAYAQGLSMSESVLFYGPSGSGKSEFVAALAGTADANFIRCTGAGLVKNVADYGEEAIKALFRLAAKHAPAVLFIDDIEELCSGSRNNRLKHDTEAALTEAIQSFCFNPKRPVLIAAATNDPGLCSVSAVSDVFGRFIGMSPLSPAERKELILQIIKKLSKRRKVELSEEFIDNLVCRTMLCVPGDIMVLFAKASRAADGKTPITETLLDDLLEELRYGGKNERADEEIKTTAYHEAGHAFVYWKSGKMPAYITVTSRGSFGGYMLKGSRSTSKENRESMLWAIRCALAGRAAETVFFGEDGVNNGALSDLEQASYIAKLMICKYGMGGNLTVISDENINNPSIAHDIKCEMDVLLKQEFDRTLMIIRENKAAIEKLAKALLIDNSLTETQIAEVLNDKSAKPKTADTPKKKAKTADKTAVKAEAADKKNTGEENAEPQENKAASDDTSTEGSAASKPKKPRGKSSKGKKLEVSAKNADTDSDENVEISVSDILNGIKKSK